MVYVFLLSDYPSGSQMAECGARMNRMQEHFVSKSMIKVFALSSRPLGGLVEGWFYVDYQWISSLLPGILEKIKYIISTRYGTLNICDIWNGSFLVLSLLCDKIIFSNNNTNNYFLDLFNFQIINNKKED